ncbi:hypothetical protein L6164_016144 [Bauhinia variegata]|uniref:Uncharacterized protein n=1 Tax=Bauhinia variegata TaxID=167791 RepID=A0ACB9NMM7_BAUVA|nr:hypothetical protein L6164_016144 [Bauhinia variegata]
MCLKTPSPGMGSESAVSTARHNAKPLNPDAEPFCARNNISLILPHEIYGCQMDQGQHPHAQLARNMVPLLLPPQLEKGFPCVYRDGQVMLLPNSLEAVNSFGPCQGGYWFNNNQSLHVSSDARCNGVYQLDNINVGVCTSTRTGKSRTVVPPPLPVSRSRWRVKATNKSLVHKSGTNGGDRHPIIPFPLALEEAENDYCWKKNLQCAECTIWAKYDFLYLPMDYMIHARDSKLSNLGYAFVNFTTARAAFEFFQQFHGHRWDERSDKKPCEVTSARLQVWRHFNRDRKRDFEEYISEEDFQEQMPKFRPVEFSPARDGFNVGIRGIPVGIYVEGLPRRSGIGS